MSRDVIPVRTCPQCKRRCNLPSCAHCWVPAEVVEYVPTDAAAVERAAEAFESALEGRGGGDEFLYGMDDDVRAEFVRDMAMVVFRAAGETP